MPHLRLALAAGGLLLALPVLSSCGFDYPTERANTIGAGVTDRDAKVDVGGAKIVAGQPDSGTLIAALTNSPPLEGDYSPDQDAITLTSITGGEAGNVQADDFDPIEIPAGGHVNLATLAEDGKGLTLTGDFDAGDFVTITLAFDNDDTVTMDVPVMKPCYQLEGLDNTQEEPSTEPLYSCEAGGESEAPAEH